MAGDTEGTAPSRQRREGWLETQRGNSTIKSEERGVAGDTEREQQRQDRGERGGWRHREGTAPSRQRREGWLETQRGNSTIKSEERGVAGDTEREQHRQDREERGG